MCTLLARIPTGRRSSHGLCRPLPPLPEPTVAEARSRLMALGDLLLRRGLARGPGDVLAALPPLLRFLKEHEGALQRAGLQRSERIAATLLWVQLHDAVLAPREDPAPIQAALEAFRLRAFTCVQATLPGRAIGRRAAPRPTRGRPAPAAAPPRPRRPS